MRALPWIDRTVIGIVLATFLSDFSHEMCTAVLPLYLSTLGFGPAALGLIDGLADFLVSVSKSAGGVVGHHVERKRPWTTLGYLTTAVATGAIALVGGLVALVSLRSLARTGRGFRGPRISGRTWSLYPLAASTMIAMPRTATADPSMSQAVGRTPSMSQSQATAVAT